MIIKPEDFLINLFDMAVQAVLPKDVLANYLPNDTNKPVIVIGAGKAAASMAGALEQHWQGPLSGLVIAPYGHSHSCEHINVIEAAHPVPDETGQEVTKRILQLVKNLTKSDLVICLISGGGSSLLSLPAPSINFSDKKVITKALLKSGANINEINCVRKHLSAIKGGQLAQACFPATIHTYAISDVPNDEASTIASGPTVADPTTSDQALKILIKYKINIPDNVRNWLNNPQSETLKEDHPAFINNKFTLIATAKGALNAAQIKAKSAGLNTLVLGDEIEGESKEIAREHAALSLNIVKNNQPIPTPCIILSGGETTVTVKGNGRGGRNAEFLLSLAIALQHNKNIYALAADTDGIDGSENNAGCLLTPLTYQIAKSKKLNLETYLKNNDAYSFFQATEQLIVTGPTLTNVNDFRAILIL
ncbi:glycerate kinase type-2 family protein [Pseudoalteromonas denitrificans]|uniref:Hydroxypyruvate reductase n=1 Tax=Pseudoalteromonas denitrificans DSM 6059 TaxID=1123010 RepID=A0A1I1L8M1_9GAMM|nr:glycerate kinase [Pseudoalteromonas denitrificans]SFC68862.1 hydroxypyruvate reductase [Pseudoalteromonas denitrificans DSM 6059]